MSRDMKAWDVININELEKLEGEELKKYLDQYNKESLNECIRRMLGLQKMNEELVRLSAIQEQKNVVQ